MDKIAAYEMLLENHPLWAEKLAEEERSNLGRNLAIGSGVAGAGLLAGLGGRALLRRRAAAGAAAEAAAEAPKKVRGLLTTGSSDLGPRGVSFVPRRVKGPVEINRANPDGLTVDFDFDPNNHYKYKAYDGVPLVGSGIESSSSDSASYRFPRNASKKTIMDIALERGEGAVDMNDPLKGLK